MSNIGLIIPERAADIGNFEVGRLLPFRSRRAVGPFVFIDHMGPKAMKPGEALDVAPHPHIGLATLTFLFEGAIMHRDSLGTEIEIHPGAVNWMTAGKGVVHSERTPDRLRQEDKTLHGLQIWIALPKELEDTQPNFQHIEAKDIPAWKEGPVDYKLIAGKYADKESPVSVYSDLYYIEIHSSEDATIDIGENLFGESALYILEGSIESDGHVYGEKQILVAKDATLCAFTIKANTKVYIFGGNAFEEERHIFWNFVHSDKAVIEKAKQDWIAQKFDKVPGETEFVPLPEPKGKFNK